MTPDRWQQITAIFHAALAREPSGREAFLAEACGIDATLRSDVDAMLAGHEGAGQFGEGPLFTSDSQLQPGSAVGVAPLATGSVLGPYQILSPLGAGGMGQVYKAVDPRLHREIAIKVLPPVFSTDPDRLARFEREARVLAALNHPHIGAIYGLEEADGIRGLVLELVEGSTLADRLKGGPVPVAEVLSLGEQIAEALEAAHSRGIIHRDLKPANVKVTPEGLVKVLDFGLAKAIWGTEESRDFSRLTTVTGLESVAGHVVGTPPYMSPEQVHGRDVDKRTDIWAFGCLLYELLTGQRAFRAETMSDTILAVLEREPNWKALPSATPASIRHMLRRCLDKDPTRRLQNISDVWRTIERAQRGWNRWQVAAIAAAALALGIGTIAAAVWSRAGGVRREIELAPPRLVTLSAMRGLELCPTFSPDGGQIAFAWEGEKGDNWDIYLKMIGSSEIARLTTDPAPEFAPSWSPDGRQIAFVRSQQVCIPYDCQGTIHLVSPVGGSDRKLSDFPVRSRPSWSPDGRWLAAGRYGSATETDPGAAGIYLIPVRGGEPRLMTSAKAPGCHHDPALSPDGHHLAYASCASCSRWGSCHVDVVDLGADYVPAGPPRRLTRRAGMILGLAWTRDGNSLIYGDWTTGRLGRVWIVGDRPPERIELAGLDVSEPATAASLDRLAFAHDRNNAAIYRFQVGQPPDVLLGSSPGDSGPHLSPDGRRITLVSRRGGEGRNDIWLAAADGSNRMQLTHGPGILQGTPRWSPDGQRIAFDSQTEDGTWDIWAIDAEGGSPRRLTVGPGNENMPSWSRDGRWIYFQSDRAGAEEIWRIPATGGSEERVTHGGGSYAYESADGKTLFFTQTRFNAPLLAMSLAGGPERKVLECVPPLGFAVGHGGVYHLGCVADQRIDIVPLYLLDPATGRDRLLGKLEQAFGLTVSPDGKTILYTKDENQGSELMMIENFR